MCLLAALCMNDVRPATFTEQAFLVQSQVNQLPKLLKAISPQRIAELQEALGQASTSMICLDSSTGADSRVHTHDGQISADM